MGTNAPEVSGPCPETTETKSYVSENEHGRYAGKHLIVDLVGATGLDNAALVEATLKECVEASGASLLHVYLHRFSPSGGISAVAVLAESHISIHSWPELQYAALDLYMCGSADPHAGIAALERAFRPARINVKEIYRGQGAL
jgi:S-adenosylmethionine decarboxylase